MVVVVKLDVVKDDRRLHRLSRQYGGQAVFVGVNDSETVFIY